MKKFLLSLAALLGFAPAFAGTGTEADPYTVADILAMDLENTNITSAYVKGYIVGSLKNGTFNASNASFTADGAVATNIMIADDASCTDFNLVAAVQLADKYDIRTSLNLIDNPGNLGKQLTIAGKVTKYCGHIGVKEPTAFTLGEGGGTTPDDPVTPPAQGALYSETFASGMGDFTIENVTLPEGLSYIFKADTQYGYIKASAYASGKSYASEAYLVSPVFDATKAAKLTAKFDQALNHFASIDAAKTEATIVARVEGGEWQTLTIPTYPEQTGWTFVNTGDINLSAFDGKKFQIAFRYISTSGTAGTWEIKNFEINGEGTLGNDAPVVENVKVANIAAFKAGKDENATYEFTSPVTAIYQNGKYLYTQDATGYLLIFGEIGQKYEQGDTIPAGFTGKYAVYHEGIQLASPAGFAASTAKGEVSPVETTLEEIGTDMINDYVKVEGVTIASGIISQDGTELVLYDSFKINPADGENLTVFGFVSWYSNKLQIVPIQVTTAGGEVVEKVVTPVFDPAAGVIFAGTPVTITCATEGADIHYTIDGTEPTADSALYTEPVVISENATLKAIAIKEGLEASSVVTAEYTIFTYEPSGFLGEFNTFNLGKTNTKYGTYKNATGWTAENCAIVSGNDTPDANESPQYAFIGDAKTLAPVLNGKTTTVGKLTSPVLDNGIKDLSFSYGLPYSDTKLDITVNIYAQDSTTLVKTGKLAPESVTKQTAYSYSLDNIDYDGKFVIEIVNNCPSDATSNKDRTAIWNLTWTAYSSAIDAVEAAEADAPVEFFNLQGVRVTAPANGIFIRRQGTKVEKVVIR